MNVFLPADILIPDVESMEKWSVIACDQFSSQPEYWKDVKETVGDAPVELPHVLLLCDDRSDGLMKWLSGKKEEMRKIYNFNLMKEGGHISGWLVSGKLAKDFEKKPNLKILDGKVVATLFFEPSTRTRLSFETAANRLGARVIGFTDPKVTSSSKGETLKDTIMMVSNYADIIVMRHFLEGAARYASEVAPVPIVNAGDGANQHPSQTMLDLYSIYKTQGTLENLNIYLVGDLKYGRTVHSLLMAMRHFNPTFHFIAPEELKMPEEYKLYCREHGIKYKEYTDFNEDTIAEADILYMTRVQRERFTDLMEYERVKDVYILRNEMLRHTRPNLRILHPLPRVNEIAYDVDENPKAYYFQQAQNGLYARQAILCDVLGITLDDVIEDGNK